MNIFKIIVIYSIGIGIPFMIAYITKQWMLSFILVFIGGIISSEIHVIMKNKANKIFADKQNLYKDMVNNTILKPLKDYNSLTEFINMMVKMIKDNTKAISVVLNIYDKNNKNPTIEAHAGVCKNMDNEIMCIKNIVEIYESHNPKYRSRVRKILIGRREGLIIPIFCDEMTFGILFIGKKIGGGRYSEEENEMFNTLANQIGVVLLSHKIIENITRETKKIASVEKLKEIEGLGGLIEGVAHQIRNRINEFSLLGIKLDVEIDKFNKEKPEIAQLPSVSVKLGKFKEFAKDISKDVIKLSDTINGIMNYANINAKEDTFKYITLDDILIPAIEILSIKYGENEVRDRIKVKEKVGIFGNKGQLVEVFSSLIDNAYEAIKEKKECMLKGDELEKFVPKIQIDVDNKIKSTIIKLSDNGIGIKDDDKSNVYMPYFTTKPNKEKVFGINMYLIKLIIEDIHKGKIWIDSEYGKGTYVNIELPRVTISQADI